MNYLRTNEVSWALFQPPPNYGLVRGHSKRHVSVTGADCTLCGIALHDDRYYCDHDEGACVRCFRIERGIADAKAKLTKLHEEAECLSDLIRTDALHKPVYERGLKYIRKEIAKIEERYS